MTHSLPPAKVRRPKSVYGIGEEPDVRFSFANERTALAWIRTGLALVAGGVALTTLTQFTHGQNVLLDLVAVIACIAGGCLAVVALASWRRNERALRLNAALPAPVALVWLVAGILVMTVCLGGYVVYNSVVSV